MAHGLRAHAGLVENSSLVLSTHVLVSQQSVTLASGDLIHLLDSKVDSTVMHLSTSTHPLNTRHTLTHINRN